MMTPEELQNRTASVEELLSTFGEKNASSPVIDQPEHLFPRFAHMQQISKCQSEARVLKFADITRRIENLEEDVSQLTGLLDSSNNMAKSLKYIVDSSRILVNLINNATRNSLLPLPCLYHGQFLQIIRNCSVIVSYKGNWNAPSIHWPEISSALKSTAVTFKDIAELLDSSIEEHYLLQHKILEMLEQMSKLSSH